VLRLHACQVIDHRAHDRQTNRTLGAHDAVHPRQPPADTVS
jgi:hypothetical protein